MKNKPLKKSDFKLIVQGTPLVSIDLIVRDTAGRILLGLRKNAPAKGFWFVPGGCVRKDESLDDAFLRIMTDELNQTVARIDATFLGVYEHLYPDNTFGEPGFGTHYIVLAYEVAIPDKTRTLPDAQHSQYTWMLPADILQAENVHPNTRAYFTPASKS